MRAPSSICKPPNYFFKLIPPGLNSQLSIPTSFRKYMKTTTTAILKKGCRKWPVKITGWTFTEGWKDFVRENGVQELDIVVFKHEGNMVFDTMVFDDSLCEKEYQTNQITESSFDLDLNTKQLKSHVMVETESLNSYPYFVTTLKQQDGNQKCIYLPVKFAVANGLRNGEMILKCAENEGSWTVHMTNHRDKFFYIRGPGFRDFCIQNGLEKGDSVKFMLIQNGERPVVIISSLPKVVPIKTEGVLDLYLQKVDFPATPSSPVHTAPGPLRAPYFKSTVKANDIKRSFVNVPMGFARANGLFGKNCEMVVMDEKHRLWPTRLCCGRDVYIRGIRDMWVANGLKEGDEFLFKLVDNAQKPQMTLHGLPKILPIKTEGVLEPYVQKVDFPATPSSPVHAASGPLLSPYFKSTATAYSIKRSLVNVPIGFARSNGLFGRNCEMVVMDEKQRLWPTRLTNSGRHVRIIGFGKDMQVANGFKEGDDFVLELVDNGNKPFMHFYKTLQIDTQALGVQQGEQVHMDFN